MSNCVPVEMLENLIHKFEIAKNKMHKGHLLCPCGNLQGYFHTTDHYLNWNILYKLRPDLHIIKQDPYQTG